ncbi:MAG: 2,3-bisphosphoglycerate-independent phosphoglycerate mutase [Ardenticatenales bacterium]
MPSRTEPSRTDDHPSTPHPVALVILDGWGIAPPGPGNAVTLARTPTMDALLATYPHAQLSASGLDVGLPEGQMGNSEVGHLNLGAGFVVLQDLTRLDAAARSGAFGDNATITAAFADARARSVAVHFVGLLGDGGVHANAAHLTALLHAAHDAGVARAWVHGFTDGRDSAPKSALGFVRAAEASFTRAGAGRFATIGGRYFGMDRDQRWDRTALAWRAIVDGEGVTAPSAEAAVRAAYDAGTTDEFIPPTVLVDADGRPLARIADGDVVVLFNFRADRMRQLLAALTDPSFVGFERRMPEGLDVVTLTAYADGQRAAVAFPAADVGRPLAQAVSAAGLRQFHAAETEKYAHVTYFLNGGREAPFEGEERLLVPSPKVATYDLQPSMSAPALCDGLVARIDAGLDDLIVVNFANPDMVGHTGVIPAAVAAVETADLCLGRVVEALLRRGGAALITADHGNAEVMIDPVTGEPHTAHTTNPVPIVLVGAAFAGGGDAQSGRQLTDGRLADVAPTLLALLGLTPPASMTGRNLIVTNG